MAMLTYGVVASGGLFIPALFIGSLWGRVFGIVVIGVLPGVVSKFEIPIRTRKYIRIGRHACAFWSSWYRGTEGMASVCLRVITCDCYSNSPSAGNSQAVNNFNDVDQ